MVGEAESGVSRGVVVAFSVMVLASACGNLAQTALNAMLTDVAAGVGVGVETAQWLTTAYMLALGVTVPAITFLMRRFTARMLVCGAVALFGAGSAVCALAGSFPALLLGRVMEAVAAGVAMPLMQTTAMASFPPGRRATAMGVAGIAMGFAPNIGPTVGSLAMAAAGWRSFFVGLTALSALLLAAAFLLVRSDGGRDATARLDAPSLALSCLGLGFLLLGLSNLSSLGLSSWAVWAPLAAGAAFVALFVVRQRRTAAPLVDMRIFASPRYVAGFLAQCLLFASYMGITLVLPLFVEGALGGGALEGGMVLLPGTVAALFVNPVAGVLTDKLGARPVTVVSACFLAVGALGMSFVDEATPLWSLMVLQGVRAVGVSGLIGPLTSWSLAGLAGPLVPHGSAFSLVARQACASFGTALMVLAVTAFAAVPLAGYRTAFALSAAFAVLTLAVCVAFVRNR